MRYRELEALLRTTLVSAERASQELGSRRGARRSVILDEAHAEARAIRRERARPSSSACAPRRARIRSLLARRARDARGRRRPRDGGRGRGRRPPRARATQPLGAATTRLQLRVSRARGAPGSSAATATRGRCASPQPPERGRANEAVVRLLADALDVPRDARRARFRPRRAGQDRRAGRPRAAAVGATARPTPRRKADDRHRTLPQRSARRARARRRRDRQPRTARTRARSRTRPRRSLGSSDNHLGDTATGTLDREIDYTLEENSEQVLAAIDARSRASRTARTASARTAAADRRGAARGAAVGELCIDCQREAERR